MRHFPFSTSLASAALLFACNALSADTPQSQPQLKDGVYKGSAKGYIGPIEVEVTVKNSKISNVKILKHSEDKPKKALTVIPKRIVEAQKPDVDAVTGATYTSVAVSRAVKEALMAAQPDKQEPSGK